MEYVKNDIITVTIEDMGAEGEGIGKVDGFTLFVKDAVLGDTVEARILKGKKNYAYARLEKILTPSPYRVEPKCPYHRQCGGCQIQALSYEKQLEFKQNKVKNNLTRIGGFTEAYIDGVMEPIVGMEDPWHYRNKAQYPVGRNKEGRPITGFYAGRTHNIIANTRCYLGVPSNEQILEIILKFMEQHGIDSYDEETGRGLVRHVLIRSGFTSGEIMVCLVLNGRDNKSKSNTSKSIAEKNNTFIRQQDALIEALRTVPGMTSICVSINTEKTNVIMGKEIHTLWGEPVIRDVIHMRDMKQEGYPRTGQQLTFHISPLSFYQVNPVQTEKLYSLALEYAGLTGRETVWDLYCGIGTISLFLATKAKQVYGIEIVPQAIDDARANAVRNGLTNAEFFVGKAEEVLPAYYDRMSEDFGKMCEGTRERKSLDGSDLHGAKPAGEDRSMLHPDVIVVDPPRKGCDQTCLDTMLKMQPNRIVYVSCDSATLARDLKILCEGGYELKRVRPVDQFGHTVSVETVCLLGNRKTKPDSHIKLSVDMDEFNKVKNGEK